MTNLPFPLADYFSRIGYRGPLTPNQETLRELHQAHVLSIPFENLDLFMGRTIVTDFPSLYQKIVVQRRGGYCYESNELYHRVLRQLNFEVLTPAARVMLENGAY